MYRLFRLFICFLPFLISGNKGFSADGPGLPNSGLSCIFVTFSPNFAACGTTRIYASANCAFDGTVSLQIIGEASNIIVPTGIITVNNGEFSFDITVSENAPGFIAIQTLVVSSWNDPGNCVLGETCEPTTLITSCAVPANDNCETAIDMAVSGDDCEMQAFSNHLWNPSGMGSSCETDENRDFFFRWIATTEEMIVETGDLPSPTMHLEVFTSCFGGNIYCQPAMPYQQIALNGLIPGNDYYLRFSDVTDAEEGVLELCIREPFQCDLSAGSTIDRNETCLDQCDGKATIIPAGGTGPFSYLWSSGGSGPTMHELCAGMHSVTVTDINGCQTETSLTIGAGSVVVAAAGEDLSICRGDTVGFQSSGGYSYRWFPAYGLSDPNHPQPKAFPDSTTLYLLSVTDTLGCKGMDTILLTVLPLPESVTNISHESGNGFSDGFAQIVPTGGTAPYRYLWSTGDTTQSVSSLDPGVYSYRLTDGNACSITDSIQIDSFICPTPIITFEVANASCHSTCDGILRILSAENMKEPLLIRWDTLVLDNPLENICAGSHSIVITDSLLCAADLSFTIDEPAEIHISLDSIIHALPGETGSIAITTNGEYNYLWTGPDGYISTMEDPDSLLVGCYTLLVSDSTSSCSTDTSFCIESITRTYSDQDPPGLMIFPNPADQMITVQFDGTGYPSGDITIRNLHGQVQWKQQNWSVQDRVNLDVSQWPVGIYLCEWQTIHASVIRRFFISR